MLNIKANSLVSIPSLAREVQDPASQGLVRALTAAIESRDTVRTLVRSLCVAREIFAAHRNGGRPFAEARSEAYKPIEEACRAHIAAEYRKSSTCLPEALSLLSELTAQGMAPHEAVTLCVNPDLVGELKMLATGDAALKGIKTQALALLAVGEPTPEVLRFVQGERVRAQLPKECRTTIEKLAVKRQEALATLAENAGGASAEKAHALLTRIDATQALYLAVVTVLIGRGESSGASIDDNATRLVRPPQAAEAMERVLAVEDAQLRPAVRQRLRETFINRLMQIGDPERPQTYAMAASEACEEFRDGQEDGQGFRQGRGGSGSRSHGRGVGTGE